MGQFSVFEVICVDLFAWELFGWEFSRVRVVQAGIYLLESCPGGNCPVRGCPGWELS